MIRLSFILATLIFFSCGNKADKNNHSVALPTPSEINGIVLQLLKQDTSLFNSPKLIIKPKLYSGLRNFQLIDSLQIVDSLDRNFIAKQDSTFSGFELSQKYFKEKQFFRSDSNYVPFKNIFIDFSIPYLSRNGNYLFIEIGRNSGPLSGYGVFYVFERRNNEWIPIRKFTTWVS